MFLRPLAYNGVSFIIFPKAPGSFVFSKALGKCLFSKELALAHIPKNVNHLFVDKPTELFYSSGEYILIALIYAPIEVTFKKGKKVFFT